MLDGLRRASLGLDSSEGWPRHESVSVPVPIAVQCLEWHKIVRMGEALLCVLCRTRPVDTRWRPFCSERCQTEDLARWAEGSYHVPSEPETPHAEDTVSD